MNENSQIAIIVNGASGKMGSLACETLEAHPDFELVARCGRQDCLAEVIAATKAKIVVDLTSAEAVGRNAVEIVRHGARPVIGSSGLLATEIELLSTMCRQQAIGGLIVPNFSIAAVLMMHFSALAAHFLPEVEIIEAHHPQKLDAPSGTAMKTAEMIQQARTSAPPERALKELVSGARGGKHASVPIHSLRLPGVVAEQSVVFGAAGETLTIQHRSIDRQSFMPGVIFACQQVMLLNELVYGLESLLLKELAR